uniref:Major facilitator superfamily (MFS) profile domain-containing protein n=1 Tax=Eutreptiella gymnastica TaxID=73025 RepID=A0A7S1J0V0_9EUGL
MAAATGRKTEPTPELQAGSALPPWLPSFAVAALGGALFGYDIGGSSAVLRVLGQGVSELGNLDALQLGYLASGSLFGAMAASTIIFAVGDKKIGRKTELQTAAGLYAIGTLIQSLGPTLPAVLLGRCVYGLGIGTAMHVAPLYIAEVVPTELRGKLVSLKEAAIVFGIVLGYLAGDVFAASGDWRTVFGLAGVLILPMAALSLAVPESPRWLALRGRTDEAQLALSQAQGASPQEAQQQVSAMAAMSTGTASSSPLATAGEIFSSPKNRKALTIGVGLVLFQQLSGQPSVLYYANRIFETAGLGFEAAVGVGVFKLLMTLVSVQLVEDERFGRRPLLIYGTTGMTVALAALALLFATAGPAGPSSALVIACVVAFVGCYQVGFGPVTWLILSEVFPLQIRSAAVSIGTLANFGSNVLVTLLFEYERTTFGEALLFGQFALIALAGVFFQQALVPETRGLTLEEIEAQIGGEDA